LVVQYSSHRAQEATAIEKAAVVATTRTSRQLMTATAINPSEHCQEMPFPGQQTGGPGSDNMTAIKRLAVVPRSCLSEWPS